MVKTQAGRRTLSVRTPWVRGAIGGLLVLSSTVGVMIALSGTRETQSVLVSNGALAPGTALREADVSVVQVPRNAVFDGYVGPQELQGSLFVSSPVGPGGMIPKNSVSAISLSDSSVVSIQLTVGRPEWLQPGATATFWVQPPSGENSFGEPFVLTPTVLVLAVSTDDGFAADATTSQIDLLVSRRALPGVLHAIANGFHISLTPTDAPAP
jgi:hypothetical protein